MDNLLTPGDVAEKLKISVYTVKNYLRKGIIKGIKVGDLWRIREEDLEEFIAQKLHKNCTN